MAQPVVIRLHLDDRVPGAADSIVFEVGRLLHQPGADMTRLSAESLAVIGPRKLILPVFRLEQLAADDQLIDRSGAARWILGTFVESLREAAAVDRWLRASDLESLLPIGPALRRRRKRRERPDREVVT